MRSFKFRGKVKREDQKFIFGSLIKDDDRCWIIEDVLYGKVSPGYSDAGSEILVLDKTEVLIDTVGQYSEVNDKNQREIYDGDIVGFHGYYGHDKEYREFIIKWDDNAKCLEPYELNGGRCNYLVWRDFMHHTKDLVIIGNIY